MRTLLAVCLLSCCTPALAAQAGPSDGVRISVTLAASATVPADARFEATLEDVSRADAAAIVLGHAQAPWPGAPFAVTIGYDPARIDVQHRYVVRARLLADDALLFATPVAAPVLTQGHGRSATLRLEAVHAAPGAGAAGGAPALVGTLWKLTALDGKAAPRNFTPRAAHLLLDDRGRASGAGGCNRYGGEYTLDGAALRFGTLVATQMACAGDGAALEPRFLAALATVRRWRLDGDALLLLDGDGRVRLRFSAPHAQR